MRRGRSERAGDLKAGNNMTHLYPPSVQHTCVHHATTVTTQQQQQHNNNNNNATTTTTMQHGDDTTMTQHNTAMT